MLKLGIAYHGNRILKHVEEDMVDCIQHNFNLVVHMFSHNDWDRHHQIMKEIIQLSEGLGLEVWIDNWGLGGPPGDKSHFLAYYPDSHQIYSDGKMDPVRVCLNSPDFRKFTKNWVDVVREAGGKTIFWDEPHLVGKEIEGGKPKVWTCRCPRCQKLFKEKYKKEMPQEFNEEIEKFRIWTIIDYFEDVTKYSKEKGMKNVVCVMLGAGLAINLSTIEEIAKIKTMDNIGTDPYWYGVGNQPYEYVFSSTKKCLEVCKKYKKEHNIWIQGFGVPVGREEEIIYATDAAYNAGARTILVWSFRGGESNDYRARNPELTWKVIGDAMARITNRYRDSQLLKVSPQ